MGYRSFSIIPALSNHLLSDRFTQMDNLFSRLTGEKPISDSPPYNLLQKDKENYEIMVSLPGYLQEELDISVLNDQLNIRGRPKIQEVDAIEKKDGIKWLHNGIKKSNFSLSFNLDHRITIREANLDQGLLTIKFAYDIPEKEKPQKISINTKNKLENVIEHHVD